MKIHELKNAIMRYVSLVRRNHALEHATLQVLAQRYPQARLAGHSDSQGLHIIGEVPIEGLHAALEEAQQRLQAGERYLAVHPYCGTNLVVGGGLAALAGALAMRHSKAKTLWDWLDKWALILLCGALALWVAQPLGSLLQAQITTNPDLQGLRVTSIVSRDHPVFGKWHRVETRE